MYSKREYECKIRLLEKKSLVASERIEELKKERSDLRATNRKLRKSNKNLKVSRSTWKSKNRSKGLRINNLEHKLKRRGCKAFKHHYELWLVGLCVTLRLKGKCSYRSVRRILEILNIHFDLGLRRLPCANSIENWVSKIGLFYLQEDRWPIWGKEVCLIIDESIRVGQEKLLLILSSRAMKLSKEALKYSDVKVCYLGGRVSWTADLIKKEVEKLKKALGFKVQYILSDEDSKLRKSARLLELPHVADISHAVGSCLRKTFEAAVDYQSFMKLITAFQYKSVNQSLSYLRPPKQRIKARFMNQKQVITWAVKMLNRFSELNEKESAFFSELQNHQPIIEILDKCMAVGQEVSLLLKTEGLNHQTLKSAFQFLENENSEEGLIPVFLNHLKSYLIGYQSIMNKNIPKNINICSDVIESLFGVYKERISKNPIAGVSLLSLELPLCCLKENEQLDIKQGLEYCFLSDLDEWKNTYSADNQRIKRIKFFENRA